MTQPLPPNPQPNPQQPSSGAPGYPQQGQHMGHQQPYQAGAQPGNAYQPPHNQGGYQQSYQQPPKTSGMTITALILGIAALLLSGVPVLGILLGLAAIIVSGIALSRKLHSKGMSIAGLIMGILGLIAGIFFTVMVFAGLAALDQVMEAEKLWDVIEKELENLDQPESGAVQGTDRDLTKELQDDVNLPQQIRPGDASQTVNPADAEEVLEQLEVLAEEDFGSLSDKL